MSREAALLVMIAVAVVLLGLGAFAWIRRGRRDAGIGTPVGEIPPGVATTAAASGFYVATTRQDQPLERLAIRGLGFRSRVDVTVTTAGVALDLVGQPRVFLPVARIDDVALANVAIDRVVEPGGLVRIRWQATRVDGTFEAVDSYLRPQDGSARALADAIAATLPAAPAGLDDTSARTVSAPRGTDA